MANVSSVARTMRIVLGAAQLTAPIMTRLARMFEGLGGWKFTLSALGAVPLDMAAFRERLNR